MHILKKILSVFINFILANAIFLFIITFSIKGIFTEGLVNEIVKDELSTQISDSLEVDKEKIEKVLENENVNRVIQGYIDDTLEGLIDEKSLDNIELGKDITTFIQENKSDLENNLGISISDDKLEEILNSEEYKVINEEYKNAIKRTKDEMPEYQKQIVRLYNFITTNTFKIILLIIIVILLVIISILKKSFYKWLKSCAISTIISGVLVLIMAYLVSFIVNTAIKSIKMQYIFKVDIMYKSAFIACIIGLVMLSIYIAINNYFNKKDNKIQNLLKNNL